MRLVSQAQLISELLSRNSTIASDQELDDEADRLADLLMTRVTLIAADGRVLGDSDLDGQALADVENHLQRPEVQEARAKAGDVARVLDGSVQELGRRLDELSRDRARLDAILSGMVEGVLVLDGNGRIQLANRAAQAMLRMDGSSIGRPYVEVIRHPDIAEQL